MASHNSIFRETFNFQLGLLPLYQLQNKTRDSLEFIQRLELETKLEAHNGCVNTICWNEAGTCILSGSDDQHLSISNPFSKKIVTTINSGHRANIFSARFLPNTQDNNVISCSGDGVIFYTQVEREDTHGQHAFVCHFGTAYEVQTIPQDSNTFLSCGEDGTVRWFDLRIKTSCGKPDCKEDVLINCRRAVTALAINPVLPWQLSVGCSDSSVRVFDRRMLGTRATGNYTGRGITGMVSRFTAPLLENRAHRITSLSYSPCGSDILVSYSSDYIYMFNLKEDGRSQKFEVSSPDSSASSTQDSSQSGEGQRNPSIKRLRLRGDWSDTGPSARPERERAEQDRGSVNIMQRMSDMLTRLLEGAARQGGRTDQDGTDQAGNIDQEQATSEDQQTRSDQEVGSTQDQHSNMEPGNRDANTGQCEKQSSNEPPECAAEKVDSSHDSAVTEPPSQPAAHPGHTCQSSQSVEPVVSDNHEMDTSDNREPAEALPTVQASQTTQEDVNPVISLQYRSEGTSASTIRLDFSTIQVPSDSTSTQSDSSSLSYDTGTTPTIPSDNVDSSNSYSTPETSNVNISQAEASRTVISEVRERTMTRSLSEGSAPPHDDGKLSADRMKLHLTPQISVEEYVSPDREQPMPTTSHFKNGNDQNNAETDTQATTAHIPGSSGATGESRPGEVHSEEEDSDVELMRAHQRKYSRPTRDENLAARRLQALYRKRQEEKEKEECELRCVHQPALKHVYKGHRNARTMIKEANFWSDRYVMSGSDCGHIFIWDRYTTQLVKLIEADKHVVNCIQPHPFFPILASSGIDYDIKIWMPSAESPSFDRAIAEEVTSRNEIMLEETRDTITVPASFMLRMLASLNHVRASASARHRPAGGDSSSDDDD